MQTLALERLSAATLSFSAVTFEIVLGRLSADTFASALPHLSLSATFELAL
jgi:hypothetical protein